MRGSHKKKTKDNIMAAAWELFRKQGYDDTTISQIIEKSNTSRSAFYHHFHGKEELLFSIAYTYDENYDTWFRDSYDKNAHTVDNLKSFNRFVLCAVESSIYRSLYPTIYGLQVMTDGVRHILNPNRQYYKIIRALLKNGMDSGEIASPHSFATLADMITSFQVGITYSYCLQQEHYSLQEYGQNLLNPFLESLRA